MSALRSWLQGWSDMAHGRTPGPEQINQFETYRNAHKGLPEAQQWANFQAERTLHMNPFLAALIRVAQNHYQLGKANPLAYQRWLHAMSVNPETQNPMGQRIVGLLGAGVLPTGGNVGSANYPHGIPGA